MQEQEQNLGGQGQGGSVDSRGIDEELRTRMHGEIRKLFESRKPSVVSSWHNKFPQFIGRLERAMYENSRSRVRNAFGSDRELLSAHCALTHAECFLLQEEYADLSSLETRLYAVARAIMQRSGSSKAQGQQQQWQQRLQQEGTDRAFRDALSTADGDLRRKRESKQFAGEATTNLKPTDHAQPAPSWSATDNTGPTTKEDTFCNKRKHGEVEAVLPQGPAPKSRATGAVIDLTDEKAASPEMAGAGRQGNQAGKKGAMMRNMSPSNGAVTPNRGSWRPQWGMQDSSQSQQQQLPQHQIQRNRHVPANSALSPQSPPHPPQLQRPQKDATNEAPYYTRQWSPRTLPNGIEQLMHMEGTSVGSQGVEPTRGQTGGSSQQVHRQVSNHMELNQFAQLEQRQRPPPKQQPGAWPQHQSATLPVPKGNLPPAPAQQQASQQAAAEDDQSTNLPYAVTLPNGDELSASTKASQAQSNAPQDEPEQQMKNVQQETQSIAVPAVEQASSEPAGQGDRSIADTKEGNKYDRDAVAVLNDNLDAYARHRKGSEKMTHGQLKEELDKYIMKQAGWLSFLRHGSRCIAHGVCSVCAASRENNMFDIHKLWNHIIYCENIQKCSYSMCRHSKLLLKHYKQCGVPECRLCRAVNLSPTRMNEGKMKLPSPLMPVINDILQNESRKGRGHASSNVFRRSVNNVIPCIRTKSAAVALENEFKSTIIPTRWLIDSPEPPKNLSLYESLPKQPQRVDQAQLQAQSQQSPTQSEGRGNLKAMQEGNKERAMVTSTKKTKKKVQIGNEDISYMEVMSKEQVAMHAALVSNVHNETSRNEPQTISEAINRAVKRGLEPTSKRARGVVANPKETIEMVKAKASTFSEEACQLCGEQHNYFEPSPMYCMSCSTKISRGREYFRYKSPEEALTRHFWCIDCITSTSSTCVTVDGTHQVSKADLVRGQNERTVPEGWVECDHCERWFHVICSLMNKRRNDASKPHACAFCTFDQLESKERVPTPMGSRARSFYPVSKLPRTHLSNYLQRHLERALKLDQRKRASSGKRRINEVPTATNLTVRVVSSNDRFQATKKSFKESFPDFPDGFNCRSKCILLFQQLAGVDTLLFALYADEFNSEAPQPNTRRVYLSYLDSVRYMEPEVATFEGEPLRSFVYHEIINGYMKQAKERGFVSCNIWACPPVQGEDYVFHIHPAKQKSPNRSRLRKWYSSLLTKAMRQGFVLQVDNLKDFFHIGDADRQRSATEVPHFEGDYFTLGVDQAIKGLRAKPEELTQLESRHANTLRKSQGKRGSPVTSTAKGTFDASIMAKIGKNIERHKHDFFHVQFRLSCSVCHNLIINDTRYSSQIDSANTSHNENRIHLCSRCYDRDKHKQSHERIHLPLYAHEEGPLENDTGDKDGIMESEFFTTRDSFLGLCQGNHYQFDTLRRAKHSSMMVLHHLHNPHEPSFGAYCNLCEGMIEPGEGALCNQCDDFDICDRCMHTSSHPHPLVKRNGASAQVSNEEAALKHKKEEGEDALPTQAHTHASSGHQALAQQRRAAHAPRASNQGSKAGKGEKSRKGFSLRSYTPKQREQLMGFVRLLEHASHCPEKVGGCKIRYCSKLKKLMGHSRACVRRNWNSNWCRLCAQLWVLTQIHSRKCVEEACRVPRCRDFKAWKRKQQQIQERRRLQQYEQIA